MLAGAAETAEARQLLAGCLDIERWVEVAGALERHPRIGERATGNADDVALSASEQAGVVDADAAALGEGNVAYEQRFGYIYLICASGLSGG